MPTAPPPSRDVAVEASVFWLRFQKEIAGLLVAVLLAIVGWSGYRFYTDRRDSAGAAELAKAKTPEAYQTVIARYPSTPAAGSAYLLLAEAQRQQKKFTDANATLQRFVDANPKHEFVPLAYLAMAANLESRGKTDEALAMYQRVAANYPDNYAAPLAMISQVTILKAQKRIEEARRICETILTKYRMPSEQQAVSVSDNRPQSMWAAEAMRQLRLLKPAATPKPAAATVKPAVPPMLAAPSPGAGLPPLPSASPAAEKAKPK
jgi:predicted negative regulator of RcsB-dependent stress response